MTIAPSGENVPRLVFVSVAKRAPLVTSNTLRSCPFEGTNDWVLFGFMVTLWIVWSSEPMPLDHGIVLFTAPDGRSMISMPFPSFSSIRPSEDNATAVVWSKNSNGLKWRGLGFCTGSLFEWAFPTGKLRLQSRFHEVIDYRGIQDALGEIVRSEEHTSELQSLAYLVCRLLLEKKNNPGLLLYYVSHSQLQDNNQLVVSV